MASLSEIRKQFPQYSDMSDQEFADALYRKSYSDMPREEFDRRIGFSDSEQPGVAYDMMRSGATGVREGVEGLAGTAGDWRNAAKAGAEYVAGKFGASPETQQDIGQRAYDMSLGPWGYFSDKAAQALGFQNTTPTSEDISGATTAVVGEHYQPQTTAGEYARTGGRFLPAALVGPGSAARRVVTQTLAPALASETAGQMLEGTAAEPWARMAGAVGGNFAGNVAWNAARKAITPNPASARRMQQAKYLEGEGVQTTAGQKTGSKAQLYKENEIGGAKAADVFEKQGEDFTAAILKRIGVDARRATPDVMAKAASDIGGQFDVLAARNAAQAGKSFGKRLKGVLGEYKLRSGRDAKPIIKKYVDDIKDAAANGTLSGQHYKSFRSNIAADMRGTSNPELKQAYGDLIGVLDDAAETWIKNNNPSDLGAWKEARRLYRNLLVVEKAASRAGAVDGIISPQNLRGAVVSTEKARRYAQGKGDFTELARTGSVIMPQMPQSGTAPRMAAQGHRPMRDVAGLATIGSGIGLATGGAPGAGVLGALGAAAGMAAPAARRAWVMSPWEQRYAANQLLGPGGVPLGQALLAGAPAAAIMARPAGPR